MKGPILAMLLLCSLCNFAFASSGLTSMDELLVGSSGMIQSAGILIMHPETGETHKILVKDNQAVRKKMDSFGYRVLQSELINSVGERKLVLLS